MWAASCIHKLSRIAIDSIPSQLVPLEIFLNTEYVYCNQSMTLVRN